MNRLFLALWLVAGLSAPSFAQGTPNTATVVSACGTPPGTYTPGQNKPLTTDTSGRQCTSTASVISGTVTANQGAAGAASWPVNIDQTTSGTTNGVVTKTGSVTNSTPAARTIITLDVKTVTTGGTAVTALTAGHRTAGGFLFNPINATINLCINEIGTATGTTSAGDTTCIAPGQNYVVTPASGAVSVISSDSSHPFSGYGLN